jgi:hypothetical protein
MPRFSPCKIKSRSRAANTTTAMKQPILIVESRPQNPPFIVVFIIGSNFSLQTSPTMQIPAAIPLKPLNEMKRDERSIMRLYPESIESLLPTEDPVGRGFVQP